MSKFQIWYMKPASWQEQIYGNLVIDPDDLNKTHVHLKELELPGGTQQLERVFYEMQGEMWSPNGEARELIESKGLHHTSMSIGDVIVDEDGRVCAVTIFGFKQIN